MMFINGVASESIAANDRGLQYGDGVFRTLRVQGGKALHWPRHYRKLAADCAALGIACPDPSTLAAELQTLAAQQDDGIAKIIVTRGASGRGYAYANAQPTRIVSLGALPDHPAEYATHGVRVRVCDLRLGWQPRLAGVKHLNRLENVLARSEWSDPGIAEGLLLDAEGNVIEGVMSNVFIVENSKWATPELSRCGVAGVQRERLLERVVCRVEPIPLERLLRADEVLLVNSLIGVWPVREIGERCWQPGTASAAARHWLAEER